MIPVEIEPERVERYRESRDHRFTGTEQSDYDSLKARGRTLYDELRWYRGYGHPEAFAQAREAHGLKSGLPAELMTVEDAVKLYNGLRQRGNDHGIIGACRELERVYGRACLPSLEDLLARRAELSREA